MLRLKGGAEELGREEIMIFHFVAENIFVP